MKTPFDPFTDDPSRPSLLLLDRFAAGELSGAERSAVQQWVAKNAYAVAHLDELRNAKRQVRPFDSMLLRARAGGLVGGERLQAQGMETFPPGMLDGQNLADLVKQGLADDSKAASKANTLHPEEDLDRSTQPFAVDRAVAPDDERGHIDGGTPARPGTPDPGDHRTEPGAPRRPRLPTKAGAGASPGAIVAPANRPMWMYAAPVVALAAAALLAVGVGTMALPGMGTDTGIRNRGGGDLEVRVLSEGAMRAWDGKPLAAGSTVGFAVAPGQHGTVVVVSVDAAGTISQWVPASGPALKVGNAAAAIVPLDGSVTLDGAAGPEVFVAVFDHPSDSVLKLVEDQWKKGGDKGLVAWAEGSPDADAVVVEKR